MKLVEQKAELIEQDFSDILFGIYKQIEKAARTAYKSEDKITEDSAKDFVERMIKSKHFSTLEHGTVYLKFALDPGTQEFLEFFKYNKYSNVHESIYKDDFGNWCHDVFITTNFRVINEAEESLNKMLGDFYDWKYFLCEPTEFHVKRYTVKLTTNRQVTHEAVRHRTMSFTQESTRYCNYSKDKFGNELTFIIPSWLGDDVYDDTKVFKTHLVEIENTYNSLLEHGWVAQQAAAILPNALKTDIVITASEDDWKHFFDLRLYGKTGAPHPDMKKAAELIHEQLIKAGYKD